MKPNPTTNPLTRAFDAASAVYTPPEVADAGLNEIRRVEKTQGKGAILGIDGVDGYVPPLKPGQLTVVLAQSGNFKTGLMNHMAAVNARRIADEGRVGKACIVYVSMEEPIEEQAINELARASGMRATDLARGNVQDWTRLKRAADDVGGVPIYRVGSSFARADMAPELTMSNMVRAIEYLRDDVLGRKLEIDLILFDYLQAFPVDPERRGARAEETMRLQAIDNVFTCRLASLKFGAPVVLGSQAKQELRAGKSPVQIPIGYDAQESAAISQHADKLITLWMPKKTSSPGDAIEHGRYTFTVDERQLVMRVDKQRLAASGGEFMAYVNYSTMSIGAAVPERDWKLPPGQTAKKTRQGFSRSDYGRGGYSGDGLED